MARDRYNPSKFMLDGPRTVQDGAYEGLMQEPSSPGLTGGAT